MGLKSVLQEVTAVFSYLHEVWAALPNMVQFLMLFTFGTVVLIAVLKSMWG